MKILWVVSTVFPQLAEHLKRPVPFVGGWMYGLAKSLSDAELELSIVTTNLESQWQQCIQEIKPDLVHIHGTEYAFGLSLLKACPNLNYVISIQGILSAISKYYKAGITTAEIFGNLTIRDVLRADTIYHAEKKLRKRGAVENQYFQKVTHIIGRTTWDKLHTLHLNPKRIYHFCNESLRSEFYEAQKWDINNKRKYTIFLSQAGYPLKGLHQVLKAVFLLQNDKSFVRLSGYGKYIRRLLKKFKLQNKVNFLGPLDTNQMIQEYQNSHVFICPSSIENSPNSLGEAQLLGVPCIAANVGGVSDMVTNNQDCLVYRFEEIEILAEHIKAIFNNDAIAHKLSVNGIQTATERHDRQENLLNTLKIYQNIIDKS